MENACKLIIDRCDAHRCFGYRMQADAIVYYPVDSLIQFTMPHAARKKRDDSLIRVDLFIIGFLIKYRHQILDVAVKEAVTSVASYQANFARAIFKSIIDNDDEEHRTWRPQDGRQQLREKIYTSGGTIRTYKGAEYVDVRQLRYHYDRFDTLGIPVSVDNQNHCFVPLGNALT